MTTPVTEDPNAPKPVGLLGRIFGKLQTAPQPPAGLEDRLSYTDKIGSNGTDAAYWTEGKVPEYDDGYFPTVPDQDKLLVHYDRPPGDENPQTWYDDRNRWAVLQREKIEHQTGTNWNLDSDKPGEMADNPNWVPPDVKRPTAFMSPTGYSFTRPYDQESEHELNGVHFSLADNRRSYALLGGNVGRVNAWNNSYRIDPVTNDSTAVFVGDTVANSVDTTVIYTNPQTYDSKNRSGRL